MKASELVSHLTEFIEQYGDRDIVNIKGEHLIAFAIDTLEMHNDAMTPFVCIFT